MSLQPCAFESGVCYHHVLGSGALVEQIPPGFILLGMFGFNYLLLIGVTTYGRETKASMH